MNWPNCSAMVGTLGSAGPLLWPPQRLDAPLLGRWPQQVRLSAVAADQAGEALRLGVPKPGPLWLNPHDADVD